MTYRTCVDNPARFGRSQCIGAHYGLTPRLYQSGETMRVGRVSKCGDTMMRAALYEAALVLLTGPRVRWSSLKVWGLAVAKRRGMQKALVAVARKLAIVLHRMWRDEKDFRWSAEADGGLKLTDQHHVIPSSSGVEEVPVGTTGTGETEETRASVLPSARLRWLRPLPLIPS